MEEEKYIKCSQCNTSVGCFLNETDQLFMYCGNCQESRQFVFILKEEFEVINYTNEKADE